MKEASGAYHRVLASKVYQLVEVSLPPSRTVQSYSITGQNGKALEVDGLLTSWMICSQGNRYNQDRQIQRLEEVHDGCNQAIQR